MGLRSRYLLELFVAVAVVTGVLLLFVVATAASTEAYGYSTLASEGTTNEIVWLGTIPLVAVAVAVAIAIALLVEVVFFARLALLNRSDPRMR